MAFQTSICFRSFPLEYFLLLYDHFLLCARGRSGLSRCDVSVPACLTRSWVSACLTRSKVSACLTRSWVSPPLMRCLAPKVPLRICYTELFLANYDSFMERENLRQYNSYNFHLKYIYMQIHIYISLS